MMVDGPVLVGTDLSDQADDAWRQGDAMALPRLLLGSVAESVIHNAPCSVLAVPLHVDPLSSTAIA